MRKVPHILHIIYKDGSRGRMNLTALTPAQRQQTLNDWTKTDGTRTAFLAWK
jgi:hypothetical protein